MAPCNLDIHRRMNDGMETNQSLILIPADSLFSFLCVLLAPVSEAVREQTISPPYFPRWEA